MTDDRYVFLVEWFDNTASLVRQYNFTFFLKDNAIEMFDIKNRRIFLKKCDYPDIAVKDLYIGGTLNVYSRQLKIIDYADQFTKKSLEKQKGKTFFMIKPDAYMQLGKILNMIEQEGFSIGNAKMVKMTNLQAEKFYSDSKRKPNYSAHIEHLSSDLVLGLQLTADDSINRAQSLAQQISKKYGKSAIQDAVYTSQSSNRSIKDRQFFFSNKSILKCPALFTSCSCLVIKPHIVNQGYVGQIMDQVLSSGFEISAMQMFWLDKASAEQFLEIYKNVIPEYSQMIEEITSGPCIAIQARQNNAVPAMRELCGPHDPQMAKTIRPKSIRSIFGKDKVKNAVHCTDLMEQGLLEVEYFFNILQK